MRSQAMGKLTRSHWSALVLSAALAACGGSDDEAVPAIVAGADTVTLAAGQSAQLLGNDSLGGSAVTSGAGGNVSVILAGSATLPAGIALDNTGRLSVAAAAAPGAVNFSYRLCETQRPDNCASAEVRLTVPAPPIVAGPDTLTLAAGASADLLANDTLAGAPASAASVTATASAALPAGIELSAAGLLSVGPGVAPGSYEFGYGICQKLALSNCASATVKLTVPSLGNLTGRAVDAATGVGIAGVSVKVGNISVLTDASGAFSHGAVAVQERVSVQFDSPDYAETTRIARVSASGSSDVQVRMLKVGVSASVDVAAGGTVSLAGSTARVSLPANGVQRADGSVPAGAMTVKLTAIDPASDSSVMPGDFTTLVEERALPIESFGAINVRLSDAAGAALNLRAGQSATIRIPLASRSANAPATIPLFYFDGAAGRWVQQGTASLAGSGASRYYEGTVSHFSTWNADQVYDTVRVLGCLADAAGTPIAGAQLHSDGVDYSGTSSAISGADGKFILPIRKSGSATVVGLSGRPAEQHRSRRPRRR